MGKRVKDRIKDILALKPWTRDCDMELLFEYWEEYLWVYLTMWEKQRIKNWPSVHTIIRHRAYIQNTEWLFKGSEDTQFNRAKAEMEYRHNYSPTNRELTPDEISEKRNEIRQKLNKA